jgi:hypothetical protein
MIDKTQIDIIEIFQKESGKNSLVVKQFLKDAEINFIDKPSILKALDKYNKELDNIIIPEGEPRRNHLFKINKRNEIKNFIYHLELLLSIVEIHFPTAKNNTFKKKSHRLEYGLLKKIIDETLVSTKFKNLDIPKDIDLNSKQQRDIFNLAKGLYPKIPINEQAFFAKLKSHSKYGYGYSKPRIIKNNIN